MNKTIKKQNYYCRRCGTIETITEQDGIKLENIDKVICPICVCKKGKHKYKMYKVNNYQKKEVKTR